MSNNLITDCKAIIANPILAVQTIRDLQTDNTALRELLQEMLNVAENCDETGYADGYGFVDIDKLHEKVRAAVDAARKEEAE